MLVAARTHDYGKQPLKELALLLKQEGMEAAQIVLPKAFIEFNSYEDITQEVLETLKESFEENQIKIHILGCYMDLGNPDASVRKYAVDTFKNCLSYAKVLGAKLVGTETAYPRLNKIERGTWYPFMMDSLMRLAEEAERVGEDMAVEPVYWHPLNDLETTENVFEKINSKRLKMIFDPANVLENPRIDQAAYWKDWLYALGDRIEAIHMKDFTEGPNKEYQPVNLGDGVIDYTEIIRWMKQHHPDIVIVREELRPETALRDICYIHELWK